MAEPGAILGGRYRLERVLGYGGMSTIFAATDAKLGRLVAVKILRPEFGAYGKEYIHSPNLDRIARRGVTFRRAYCQQAVCSPSRSSLLTGTRPDTTKVWDLETHFRRALPDVVTLPQHFKQHGYFVQGMGKLYHGGFDDPQSWSVPWSAPKTGHGTYGLPENMAIVKAKQEGATRVRFPFASSYQVPNPKGDWSYLAHSGKGYKIDHVIHTPGVLVTEVEYLTHIGDRHLAGEKSNAPISDHAALRFRSVVAG